jgi:hypothetical protein
MKVKLSTARVRMLAFGGGPEIIDVRPKVAMHFVA